MLSADTVALIYSLIEQGLPCRDIAARVGISPERVRYYGVKVGADMNRLGRYKQIPLSDAQKAKILHLLSEGVPHRKIAKTVKCGAASVSRLKNQFRNNVSHTQRP